MDANGATFTIIGLVPGGPDAKVLGAWTALPARGGGSVAFGELNATAWPAEPVWLAHLPADPVVAAAALSEAELSVAASAEALDEAADRLVAFINGRRSRVSFGPASGDDVTSSSPERDLAQLLSEVASNHDIASFGDFNGARAGWDHASQWFADVAGTVVAPLDRLITIETALGGTIVARSTIGLGGDCSTLWKTGSGVRESRLHGRTVALALATRVALVRTLALALRGAAIVAVAIGTPGGALVALPAVWHFITGVQDEVASIRHDLAMKGELREQS